MNSEKSESFVKDVLHVDHGYKKFFVTALLIAKKTLTSQKNNQYESLLIQDHTGIVKVLNLNLDLKLETNKAYNFLLDTKGHPYNPVTFLKESSEISVDPAAFQVAENSPESAREEISNLVKPELMLTLQSVDVDGSEQDAVKKITLKDEQNTVYNLRLWPNNQPYYDLNWSSDNTDREIFFQYVQVYKRENSNYGTLKVIPEYTTITLV